MANDNQTALMQSIQRKKDRIESLSVERGIQRTKYREVGGGLPWNVFKHGQRPSEITAIIYELELQIAEDEKLLAVDQEQWIKSYIMGRSDQHDQMNPGEWKGDEFILDSSERKFHEKHGTDGK